MSDSDVVVTDHDPRPSRPDSTEAQAQAETRAKQTVSDLDAGLVSRRGAIDIKRAAKRAVGGHDLARGISRNT
jgi:hypothetical protein